MNTFREFPRKSDWKRISQSLPFERLSKLLDKLDKRIHPTKDDSEIFEFLELHGWLYHLKQRLNDTRCSYILMRFYYEQGIPDEQWITNEIDSWRYFPNFDKVHFLIKKWFDFYADTTYYKLFTIWDTLGHFLNIKYHLGVKQDKVHFARVVNELSKKDKNQHAKYQRVLDSPEFKKANSIRNNITHNYLPHQPGIIGNRRTDNKDVPGIVVSFGINKYISSSDIVKNIDESLKLLEQTFEYLLA